MSLSRRAFARLAVTGAAGLALLRPGRLLAEHSVLDRWATLGRIWREMSAHWRSERGERREADPAFDELKQEMAAALDTLPASPELRAMFEERRAHIHRSRYSLGSCYAMSLAGDMTQRARGRIERQVCSLHELAEKGRLSPKTLRRAAKAMAPPTEYLAQSRKLYAEKAWHDQETVAKRFRNGQLEPGDAATLAAKRGAELTVDRLGDLAGQPEDDA